MCVRQRERDRERESSEQQIRQPSQKKSVEEDSTFGQHNLNYSQEDVDHCGESFNNKLWLVAKIIS